LYQELEYVVVNNEDLSKQSEKLVALKERLITHFRYVSERIIPKQPEILIVGNQLLSVDTTVAQGLSPGTIQSKDLTKVVISVISAEVQLQSRDITVYNKPKVRIS